MANSIQFYTDEHVHPAVVRGLRSRNVDVLTCQEAGFLGATDHAHLIFATSRGRVLFTHDADFVRLHASGMVHSGIAYAPGPMSVGDCLRGLWLIYQVLEPADMVSQLEYL